MVVAEQGPTHQVAEHLATIQFFLVLHPLAAEVVAAAQIATAQAVVQAVAQGLQAEPHHLVAVLQAKAMLVVHATQHLRFHLVVAAVPVLLVQMEPEVRRALVAMAWQVLLLVLVSLGQAVVVVEVDIHLQVEPISEPLALVVRAQEVAELTMPPLSAETQRLIQVQEVAVEMEIKTMPLRLMVGPVATAALA